MEFMIFVKFLKLEVVRINAITHNTRISKKIGSKILFPWSSNPEFNNEFWIWPYEKKSIIEMDRATLDLWVFLKAILRISQDAAANTKNNNDGKNNSSNERKLVLYEKTKSIGKNAKSNGCRIDDWKSCISLNFCSDFFPLYK